jgi:predicted transcriptional regulator
MAQQNERAVLQAIDAEQAAGKPGATANRIADLTTYSRARVGEVLARLERAGAVEPVEFDATVGKGATKAVKGWRRATD